MPVGLPGCHGEQPDIRADVEDGQEGVSAPSFESVDIGEQNLQEHVPDSVLIRAGRALAAAGRRGSNREA